MRHIFCVLLIIQFTFLTVLSQITFTREWVTGKRSTAPSQLILKDNRGHHYLPVLHYLMKNENLRKGSLEKRYALPFPWRINDDIPKSGDPLKDDENVQYDLEIPNQKFKPTIP